MKKFFVILFFLSFFGCNLSPFKDEYKERSKIWSQNKKNRVYQESLKTVFDKTKEAVKEHGENIKNEYIEKYTALVETNNLKVTLKEIQTNLVEVTIKANSLKNKELSEKITNEITVKINSVEFDKQGKVVN